MKNLRILFALSLTLILGCSEGEKKIATESIDPIEGVWKRLGTIQIVNGVHVDTLLTEDSDDTLFAQTKILKYGHSIFILHTPGPENSSREAGSVSFGDYL